MVNLPSIKSHKNLVYGQAQIKDIVPYEDVNTIPIRIYPSSTDTSITLSTTDWTITSAVPPSV